MFKMIADPCVRTTNEFIMTNVHSINHFAKKWETFSPALFVCLFPFPPEIASRLSIMFENLALSSKMEKIEKCKITEMRS